VFSFSCPLFVGEINMMSFSVLAVVSFFMNVVAVVFIICAVVLILTILIQKGRGGGLGAAFGGVASGILGSKTGDFLTWVTIAMVSIFLMLAVVMAKFYKPSISDFGAGQPQPTQQSPVQQELPQGVELPLVPAEAGDEGIDANSLGD
jgi:preprotein translocase subunit SecG